MPTNNTPAFRYLTASGITAAVDYLIFTLSWYFTKNIFISVGVARVFATVVSYLCFRNFVFKFKGSIIHSFVRFIMCVIGTGFLSAALIDFLSQSISFSPLVGKIIAETLIFLVGYQLQRKFVFY